MFGLGTYGALTYGTVGSSTGEPWLPWVASTPTVFPKILYTDLSTYTFSSLSSNPTDEYAEINLTNYLKNVKWMSSTTASGQSLTIAFAAGKYCDTLILDNHNCISVMNTGSIRLQAGNLSNFSDMTNVAMITVTANGTFMLSFTRALARYWRILYDGDLNEPPYIGNLFLDSVMQFENTYQWNYKKDDVIFTTSDELAINGSIITAQNYTGRYESAFKFSLHSEQFRQKFLSFISATRGKAPFYFIDYDGSIRYAILKNDYSPIQVDGYNLNSILDFSFKGLHAFEFEIPTTIEIFETEEYISTVS